MLYQCYRHIGSYVLTTVSRKQISSENEIVNTIKYVSVLSWKNSYSLSKNKYLIHFCTVNNSPLFWRFKSYLSGTEES